MQIHTLKTQSDPDAPATEIVTAVEARAFPADAEARRFWELVNTATRGSDLSVMRISTVAGDRHVVVVLGDREQLNMLLGKFAAAGTPYELTQPVLEALVLRRVRVLLSAGTAGKPVNTVIRRGPQRVAALRPDGSVSPLKRPRG